MAFTFSEKYFCQTLTPPMPIPRSKIPIIHFPFSPTDITSRAGDCYFMFRAFIPGEAETAKLHCIHMEEIENEDETKTFKAIFFQSDPLEWFDT
jgi:hypothetical protein